MATIRLSDHEKECIAFLADRFPRGENEVNIQDIPGHNDTGRDELILAMVNRFENYFWLEWRTNMSLTIKPVILEIHEQIANPPPKDYWKDVETWFRSKPWSVPTIVIFVTFPLIAGWIEILTKFLSWIGVTK
jgi:hypothetical protein